MALGAGLTVVPGRNGAGKTNLLEGLYFGCTGRSCRTTNEREVVRFGAGGRARGAERRGATDGAHELTVGFEPGPAEADARRRRAGRAAARAPAPAARRRVPARSARAGQGRAGAAARPPRPGRRGAVAGARRDAPASTRRRWRSATRCSRGSAPGRGSRDVAPGWDAELARHGIALMSDRARALELLRRAIRRVGAELGLDAATRASLPAAVDRDRARRARRGARRAHRRSTSSVASPATARTAMTSCSRTRARAARLRIAGPAAARAPRAPAGRARGDCRGARRRR